MTFLCSPPRDDAENVPVLRSTERVDVFDVGLLEQLELESAEQRLDRRPFEEGLLLRGRPIIVGSEEVTCEPAVGCNGAENPLCERTEGVGYAERQGQTCVHEIERAIGVKLLEALSYDAESAHAFDATQRLNEWMNGLGGQVDRRHLEARSEERARVATGAAAQVEREPTAARLSVEA